MTAQEKKKTILIVDDIPDNIEVLRGVLSSRYRVKIATNGPKALALAAAEEPPDLVLLDVMMPGMNGLEVCSALKAQEKTRNIPVIFVTAKSETVDEEQGFKVGAVDYITKPIIPQIAEARVATHLALRQAMCDLEHQNEVLTENARLRDQVERVMRHDLKTPLTAFLGIPGLLKRRRDLPPDVLEIVAMLEKSGLRMLEMINKSMDLYRMEVGTYQLHPVPVEIMKLLRQIRFELGETLSAGSVTLEVDLNGTEATEGAKITAMGEETLYYSLMANFIKNAVEACPENGTVRVGVDDRAGFRMSIWNPGVIPAEIRGTFLQKFATFGKRGGTGLGGYSARLMAEVMGGTVRFTTDERAGTTIVLEFPGETGKAPSAGPLAERPAAPRIGDLRVLVLDENTIVLETINEVLRIMGLHQIHLTRTGREARNLLQSAAPVQLIITDWNMTDLDGGEFLSWLRSDSRYATVPVIIVTSDLSADRSRRASLYGVSCIIGKPFSPDTLTKKVEGLLDAMRAVAR